MATNRTKIRPRARRAQDSLTRDEILYLWSGYNILDGSEAFTNSEPAAAWERHKAELLPEYISQFPGTRPWAWWQYDVNVRDSRYSCELGQDMYEPEYTYLRRMGLLEDGEEALIDAAGYRPVLEDEAGYWQRSAYGRDESLWKPVSKWVKLARERNTRDLEDGQSRGLWFDFEAADRATKFFHLFLRHWKGEWAGRPFRLSSWQQYDIIYPVFGWKSVPSGVNMADLEGMPPEQQMAVGVYRRYAQAYTELCRKNGKSTLLSGVSLYLLMADREPGAEIYSGATKKDQAKIVWETAVRMAAASPDLNAYLTHRRSTLELSNDDRGNVYKPLGADGDTLDGLNSHGNIIDELHQHKTPEVLDKLITGTGSRRQPLTWAITTAGARMDGVCWRERSYGLKILEGHQDDSYFIYITCLDNESDWDNREKWITANPNMNISVYPEYLEDAARKAKESPSHLNIFLRMHCGIWTEQLDYWLPMASWDACGTKDNPVEWRNAQLERLKGQICVAGLDIGATADLTALVLIFWEPDGVITCLPWFWIPGENAVLRSKNDRAPYVECIRDGFITPTQGNITDYAQVVADISAIKEQFSIAEIDVDPLFQGAQLCQDLAAEGINIVEFPQSNTNFAEPTRELEELVLDGKLQHGSNPVLRWMAANVVVRQDVNGNKRPDKKRSSEKIDGIVALIMGLGARKRIPQPLSPDSWVALV